MKAQIYSTTGEKKQELELPSFFSEELRQDLIAKVFRQEKEGQRQQYGVALFAGKRASAPGKVRHQRRRWRGAYGMGIARVPRKVMSRRGRRFFWQGAFAPGMTGGRMAHPAKAERVFTFKINKKERLKALKSALAATTSQKLLEQRYSFEGKLPLNLPIVLERKIEEIQKVKELEKTLHALLKTDHFFPEKSIRAGRGKMRGRKYKKTAGLLLVVSKADKLKGIKAFDVREARVLTLSDLAPGGVPGRLTIFSHPAILELQERFKEK